MNSETALATVRQYIEAFKLGDVDAMAAMFDVKGQILDGLPPHA